MTGGIAEDSPRMGLLFSLENTLKEYKGVIPPELIQPLNMLLQQKSGQMGNNLAEQQVNSSKAKAK